MLDLRAPFIIGFQVTGLCTLNCVYCYASNSTRVNIPYDDALIVSRELINAGIFSISIEGGEPLMHPNWYEIALIFIDAGMEVAILSNGTLCNNKIISNLKHLSQTSQFFTFQISLDSHRSHVHDITRGKGDLVLSNISRFANANINIAIASVVHKYNMTDLTEMIDALYPNCSKFHFMNLMKITKSYFDFDSIMPSKSELTEFWGNIKTLQKEKPEISISTPYNSINSDFGEAILDCPGYDIHILYLF